MKIWRKPPIYTVIHIATGMIGYFFPLLLVAALMYHVVQYILDVRFFAFEGTYEDGNSLEHTALKLLEIGAGYLGMKLIKTDL